MSADFTPTMGTYIGLRPFRFWCQKVLPLVYDDSLSYYELLNKVVDYLNKCMEDIETLHEDVDDLHDAYVSLQNYVNNYFNNLDVQEEINNKLDEMAEDGSLSALIQPLFDEYKEEIDEEIDEFKEDINEEINVQNSVLATQNNNIAVLESRMDTFASLTDGSTTGDAELADIRVGANGKIYASAGDAVRGQVEDIENNILNFKDGYYDRNLFKDAELYAENKHVGISDGHIITSTNNDYNTYIIKVKETHCYIANSQLRFALPLESDKYTAANNAVLVNVNGYIDMNNYPDVAYLAFSFNKNTYPPSTFKIVDGRVIQIDGSVLPKWASDVDYRVRNLEALSNENLFNICTLIRDNGYIATVDGFLTTSGNNTYSSYILPVDGESNYIFTHVRFAVKLEEDLTTVVGSLIENADIINSTGAKYIAFSFDHNAYPVENYKIYSENANIAKSKCDYVSGAIGDGESLVTGELSAIKDGYSVIFKGFLSSFNSLKLAFVNAPSTVTNYVEVNSTKLIVKNGYNDPTEFTHGITIANEISILFEMKNSYATISLISNGEKYSETVEWNQFGGNSRPKIISSGTVCTDAKLSIAYDAVGRKIWYFGDSYITMLSSQRWAYYLEDYGYSKNALLSGFSGASSAMTSGALTNLLKYGKPDIIVFATGMNDGSDTDSPASLWATNRDAVINIAGNSELVFCTIPTVPTVNNEQKNSWVRSSGYRYIDFAKAVGANSSGEWYSGMLSADGVHPTAKGAKALFSQALSDLPELMV